MRRHVLVLLPTSASIALLTIGFGVFLQTGGVTAIFWSVMANLFAHQTGFLISAVLSTYSGHARRDANLAM
jgi:hypothetical protein